MLAAQLLSLYNEETKPREVGESVLGGGQKWAKAKKNLFSGAFVTQPGLEDEGHPSDAFRQGSQSTVHPGMSPGASGKAVGMLPPPSRKMSGVPDRSRCGPSSSGREPRAPREFGSHLQQVWPQEL